MINGHEEPTQEEWVEVAQGLLKESRTARALAVSYLLIDPEVRTLKEILDAPLPGVAEDRVSVLLSLCEAGYLERVYRLTPAGREAFEAIALGRCKE